MTLACEDAYSKLVEVVTVPDISGEDCVLNSLLQIWKLRFGHKAFVQTLSTLVKIWSWILVNILKLGLVKILTLDLVEIGWNFEVDA